MKESLTLRSLKHFRNYAIVAVHALTKEEKKELDEIINCHTTSVEPIQYWSVVIPSEISGASPRVIAPFIKEIDCYHWIEAYLTRHEQALCSIVCTENPSE